MDDSHKVLDDVMVLLRGADEHLVNRDENGALKKIHECIALINQHRETCHEKRIFDSIAGVTQEGPGVGCGAGVALQGVDAAAGSDRPGESTDHQTA